MLSVYLPAVRMKIPRLPAQWEERMNQQAAHAPQDGDVARGNDLRRVTVLEALAEPALAIGPCRSNQTTASAGDADDQ